MKKITPRTDRTKLKQGLYLSDGSEYATYYRIVSDYNGNYYKAKVYMDDLYGHVVCTHEFVKLSEADLIGMYIVGEHLECSM